MVEYHITCTSTFYFKSRFYFGKNGPVIKWSCNHLADFSSISNQIHKLKLFITLNKQAHIYYQANLFSLLAILLTIKKFTISLQLVKSIFLLPWRKHCKLCTIYKKFHKRNICLYTNFILYFTHSTIKSLFNWQNKIAKKQSKHEKKLFDYFCLKMYNHLMYK